MLMENKKIYIAPIAGVTDFTYRGILEKFKPDMLFTEMVSVNALTVLNEKTLSQILRLREGNAVQIFGNDIEKILYSAKYIEKLGVKHIDLNSGCPMKKVVCNGYGAALIKTPEQIRRILFELREKLDSKTDMSIKIRVGYDKVENYLEIAKIAEEVGCKHITVHGRTRAQLYSGKANWDLIKEVKESVDIPVIGNGDIFTAEDALEKINYSNVDGVMLARGIFGNPWLIREIKEILQFGKVVTQLTDVERIEMAIEHVEMTKIDNPDKTFVFDMRKHICWYLKGIRNSTGVKNKLNKLDNYDEIVRELKILMEQVLKGE